VGDSSVSEVQQRSLVIDFDGTVTEDDLLDAIALGFGDPAVYQVVEDGLDTGAMPLREVITREFRPVRAPLEEVVDWVLEHARVRRGFRELVQEMQEAGWQVHIVSSGFHELIEPVLERERVDVELHANRVDARPDGWRVEWRYPDDCAECGESCKAGAAAGRVRRLRGRRLLRSLRRRRGRPGLRDQGAGRLPRRSRYPLRAFLGLPRRVGSSR
jgi:HAD superfamily phosphoserine phosphatase-like hydrolase